MRLPSPVKYPVTILPEEGKKYGMRIHCISSRMNFSNLCGAPGFHWAIAVLTLMAVFLGTAARSNGASSSQGYREIQVVDAQTGRGVPLVELDTVDRVRHVTDSAGRIAFQEPGLMNQTVFFSVRSHGYALEPDGFGITGVRVETKPGEKTVIKIKRVNIAERLYRITGAGIYRDSVLLGESVPPVQPLLNAQVVGQDSVQAALYRGRIFWFWGDTSRLSYPLGNFRTSGATSLLPQSGGLDPSTGINPQYFTNQDGFSKGMCPFEPKDGVIWIDGLVTVADDTGRERLVTHFTRLKGLGSPLEHGLAIYNDDKEEFERHAAFKMEESWQCPRGPVFKHREKEKDYYYFSTPFPNVRVYADLKSIGTPRAYEAWTCLEEGSSAEPKKARLKRDASGQLIYRWTTNAPPTGPVEEKVFIQSGLMKMEEAHFSPIDTVSSKPIRMHGGSVRWNPWRQRWVLIAVQQGGSSFLGEVWYAEAKEPTGPWLKARKIATHDRYTFYNPVHHDFLDQEGGRVIYFEGTYSKEFSGNPEATPRYDYNQIMYRLDLADPRLNDVREK
jgi:hypothetical protein